jgi:hypothetical protein
MLVWNGSLINRNSYATVYIKWYLVHYISVIIIEFDSLGPCSTNKIDCASQAARLLDAQKEKEGGLMCDNLA